DALPIYEDRDPLVLVALVGADGVRHVELAHRGAVRVELVRARREDDARRAAQVLRVVERRGDRGRRVLRARRVGAEVGDVDDGARTVPGGGGRGGGDGGGRGGGARDEGERQQGREQGRGRAARAADPGTWTGASDSPRRDLGAPVPAGDGDSSDDTPSFDGVPRPSGAAGT